MDLKEAFIIRPTGMETEEYYNTNHETKPYQHASRGRAKDSRERPIGGASKND